MVYKCFQITGWKRHGCTICYKLVKISLMLFATVLISSKFILNHVIHFLIGYFRWGTGNPMWLAIMAANYGPCYIRNCRSSWQILTLTMKMDENEVGWGWMGWGAILPVDYGAWPVLALSVQISAWLLDWNQWIKNFQEPYLSINVSTLDPYIVRQKWSFYDIFTTQVQPLPAMKISSKWHFRFKICGRAITRPFPTRFRRYNTCRWLNARLQ